MANVMEIVVKAQDMASDVIEGVGSAGSEVASSLEDNWGKIAVAGGIAGAATEGFARTQADSNATLRRASIVTGETEGSLRKMIDGVVDHTFSAHDAAAAVDRLVKSNVTSKDEMEELLPLFDTYADATGKDMVQGIDEIDRVLSALGIPLQEAGDHLDTFTFLSNETTVGMDKLGMLMRREAATLQEYGMGTDDVAVAMAALEAEGIRGPRAVMAFQNALKEGGGTLEGFEEALGVSADTLDTQRQRLADAEGSTEEYADANNSAMTVMEKMQANVQNLMFRFGGLSSVASALGPILIGLGPATKALSLAKSGLGKTLGVVRGGFMKLWAVMMANPFILIAVAVAALVALIIMNWETVRDFLLAVWEWIAQTAESVWNWIKEVILAPIMEGWRQIMRAWNAILSFLVGIWDSIFNFARGIFDSIRAYITAVFNIYRAIITSVWNAIAGFVTNVLNRLKRGIENIFNAVRSFIQSVWNAISSIVTGVVNGIRNAVTGAFNALRSSVQSIFNGIRSIATSVWNGIRAAIINPINSARNTVMNAFRFVRDQARQIWTSMVNTFRSILDRMAGFARSPINGVIGIINRFINALNRINVKIPDFPGLPGRGQTIGFNIPRIPTLQRGGIFMAPQPGGAGLAMLHDRERVLPDGTRIGGAGIDVSEVVDELKKLRNFLAQTQMVMDFNGATIGVLPGDISREVDRGIRRTIERWNRD